MLIYINLGPAGPVIVKINFGNKNCNFKIYGPWGPCLIGITSINNGAEPHVNSSNKYYYIGLRPI